MDSGPDLRKSVKPGETDEPRVERTGHVWSLRSTTAVREVLRARASTSQAGFTAEAIPKDRLKHHPILISDGPLHDEQRTKVGRFLAPKVVAERYTAQMHECAERLLEEARATGGRMRLDDLALYYTVEVTAEVVGLTNSPVRPMAKRLVTFFNQPGFDITRKDLGRTRRQWMQAAFNGLWPIARFYLADVRPATRERRRQPKQDIISHLINDDYTDVDILVECITYGTAGMVTTREFIAMAAWHLLHRPELRQRYLVAPQTERFAILNEIIRLEPVVGHLYRRARSDLEITDGDETRTVREGDLLDLCIRQANTDPETVGAEPHNLCPGRDLPSGIGDAVMSFGDGAHKCPGQPLAILESDVLLRKLLGREVEIVAEPEMGWDDLISGYSLRGFELRLH